MTVLQMKFAYIAAVSSTTFAAWLKATDFPALTSYIDQLRVLLSYPLVLKGLQ